jgi:hypothetical protein
VEKKKKNTNRTNFFLVSEFGRYRAVPVSQFRVVWKKNRKGRDASVMVLGKSKTSKATLVDRSLLTGDDRYYRLDDIADR